MAGQLRVHGPHGATDDTVRLFAQLCRKVDQMERNEMMSGPNPEDLRAKVFEDRITPGDWRIEKMDGDGGYEVVKVFTGSDAREQAIPYAKREFGVYHEIRLEPTAP
jgi:hypothetical protein